MGSIFLYFTHEGVTIFFTVQALGNRDLIVFFILRERAQVSEGQREKKHPRRGGGRETGKGGRT